MPAPKQTTHSQLYASDSDSELYRQQSHARLQRKPRQRKGPTARRRSTSNDDGDLNEEADVSRLESDVDEETSGDELDVLDQTSHSSVSIAPVMASETSVAARNIAPSRAKATRPPSPPASHSEEESPSGSDEDSEIFHDLSTSSQEEDELAEGDSILDDDDSREFSGDMYSDVDSDSASNPGDSSFQPESSDSESEESVKKGHLTLDSDSARESDGDDVEAQREEAEELARAAIISRKEALAIAFGEDRWTCHDVKTVIAVVEVFRAILNTAGKVQERRIRKTDLIMEQLSDNRTAFLKPDRRHILEDNDVRDAVKLYVALSKHADAQIRKKAGTLEGTAGFVSLKDLLQELDK